MKIKRIHRIISAILAITMLNEIMFPTVMLALTSQDTQPEVWGYQPVDATDNVGLTSGAFNYTIPITSIPEYPMAIGYSSGIKMDQEAGCFGLGFSGFSGAISRSLIGLPDDVNGAVKQYRYENQKRWDASVKGTLSAGKPIGAGMSFGGSVSLQIGYNNYKGVYGALGVGLGLSAKLGKGTGNVVPALGGGVSLIADSRESGIRFGAGAGVGISYRLSGGGSISESIGGLGLNKTLDNKSSKMSSGAFIATQVGKSVFPQPTSTSSSALAPLSYVLPNSSGLGVSVTVPVNPSLSVTGEYSQFKSGDEDLDKKAYGFMYLKDYNRREYDHLADMTIEGEDSHNNKARNTPSYLQRDFFAVNAMGMSGSMQLFQKEYGVVSRNRTRDQFREIGLAGVKTSRKEVYPWVNVTQTKINKSVDILALLKKKEKPEDKDFDNVLFDEHEKASLTDADKTFDSYPEFKMRGDLTGEFDLASKDFKDHEVNTYDLLHISGINEDAQFNLLGVEKGMPLYQPNPAANTSAKFDGTGATHTIEKGTNIKYRTIGDILSAYSTLIADNATAGLDTPGDNAYNFNQSFYSHYNYSPGTVDLNFKKGSSGGVISSSGAGTGSLTKMNILEHIQSLASSTSNGNVNGLIGSVEVQSVNGLRYLFNLPVFNKTNVSKQLQGKGDAAPENNISTTNGDDYVSFRKGANDDKDRNRGKATIDDKFIYPYAWLLTAIVGDDYIDFDNIPGPSDGDIGYWVKFKYVKVADDYRWRTPFTGMNHIPGAISANDDDIYSVSTGTKEIYYLEAVESANYTCSYTMQKRFDGMDAKGLWNGSAYNSLSANSASIPSDPTGTGLQYLVTKIDLYKKHDSGDNSKVTTTTNANPIKGTKIKSTVFEYDYSLCPQVPNNVNGGGKATLRKVQHVAYNESGLATYLPSYQFNYFGDEGGASADLYNPAYDKDQVDQWGNYYKNAKAAGNNNGINYYTHYTELNKTDADENARVYNLSKITLPSGGSMNVDYQAQSYGFVENKTPYVMRHLTAVTAVASALGTDTELTVDISDLGTGNLSSTNFLKPDDELFGEVAFYRINNSSDPNLSTYHKKEKSTFMVGDTAIVVSVGVADTETKSQKIVVRSKGGVNAPFIYKFKQYMYTESLEMRALKESVPQSTDLNSILPGYENMEKDGPLKAAQKVVANVRNVFKTDAQFESDFNTMCFGVSTFPSSPLIYPHWSYLRTPIYKGKYTGSSVKSITLMDDFRYATQTGGTVDPNTPDDNTYGTNYYYDLNGDGTGVSAGVATIEPGGGKSCVIDVYDLQGAGFAPGPSIVSSKTTLENLYAANDDGSFATGSIVSRKKGKTVYEFYTAKDDGLQFKSNFKAGTEDNGPGKSIGRFYLFGIFTFLHIKFKIFSKQVSIKVPHWIKLVVKWDRFDKYHLNSYAYTDNTDIFGRPKSIKQIDASGQDIGNQHFTYYGVDEPVTVYNNSGSDFNVSEVKKPGKMDQAWSEAYYSKTAKVNYMYLLLNAHTDRDFSYTSMKYSYVPPVLKEVSSTMDGLKTTTQNTGYDYFNGSPIEVKSRDSYGNTKIVRTVPAYWKYPQMGSSFNDPNNINNLTASSGTYMYLSQAGNPINNNYLLGAGVVEWRNSNESGKWQLADYLQPQQKYVSSTQCKYDYALVPGNTLQQAYADAGSTPVNGSNSYIKRNSTVYKTYKGYTYEVPLDADGTFKDASFTPFNYAAGSNNLWKLLSTNQLYAANGVLLQSKDVLNKYAAQLLGCNFSNTIGAVSNASWGASAYDGAENTYTSSTGQVMLESNKFAISDATIAVYPCKTTYSSRVLDLANFPISGSYRLGHKVAITPPATPVYETPFAKIDVIYNTNVPRSLYVSLKPNGAYKLVSNTGEEFNGFFTFPLTGSAVDLVFNPNDYVGASFTKDASFPSQGYTVTTALNANIDLCIKATKTYEVPLNDCIGEAHTGNYAFVLDGNKTGTLFTMKYPTVSADEFSRKFKALVWVHNSSPNSTQLVAQLKHQNNAVFKEYSTTKATPYAQAGNWSLLRIDFDLTGLVEPKLSDYVEVFVKNPTPYGKAIYDDIRVLPYHADMTNWVFDHQFNRVVSGLDNDHFASYSTFDARGRVMESAVEIENTGTKTVQKFIYNDQKKN